ncbi:MAG: hypothetical protein NTW94_06725 [Legionellales bacterium]|nr:hypothetical protein [Legionellales bacterium]
MSRARREPIHQLTLAASSGKPIQLTAPQLEKWFAHAEHTLHPTQRELHPTEMNTKSRPKAARILSYFGLQSATDVITFLNSPTGKVTLALIAKQLAEDEGIREDEREELLQHQRQKRYAMAFLLLGLMHRHQALAERRDDEAQREFDKHLKSEAESQQAQSADHPASKQELQLSLKALNEASTAISDLLNHKLHEAEALEKSIEDIEKLILQSEFKYTTYMRDLDQAYQSIALWSHTTPFPLRDIQQKMDALNVLIENDAEEIANLIALNRDDNAHIKLETNNARNLQIVLFQDLLSVHKGTKVMLNDMGQTTVNGRPIQFHEATFIIPKTLAKTHQIVCKNRNYYLLQTNASFEALSPEERARCEKAYFRLRPEILGVKHWVEHNRTLETAHHHEQKSRLSERSVMMQQDISLIASQLTKIKATEAEVESLLNPEPKARPKMTPTPAPTKSLDPSSPHWSHSSYHHMIQLMHSNPTTSSLHWLKGSVAESPSRALKHDVAKLEPGKPIPELLMKSLLQRRDLGNVWLNPAISLRTHI